MKTRLLSVGLIISVMFIGQASIAGEASPAVFLLLEKYQNAGVTEFSAERGKYAWVKKMVPKPTQEASCSTCHGTDVTQNGQHAKTHKVIEPMALSIQPDRFQDAKKIEKWFKRNCKWAWGRECTPQEKGDFLAYLTSQ